MNDRGSNGNDKRVRHIDISIKESMWELLEKKAKEYKVTTRGLLVEIIESWVADVRMRERLKEERDSKKIYTETPDPEPEVEVEDE